jgi:hypothetical protein
MLARSPLLTALRRSETIWGVLLLVGMGNALRMLVVLFAPRLDESSELSASGSSLLWILLISASIGMLAAGIAMEFLGAHFTWVTPGLHRRLERELALVLALTFLGCLAIATTQAGEFHLAPMALLGFGLGATIADSRPAGTLRAAAGAALILLAVSSNPVAEFSGRWPVALLLIGPPFAVLVMRRGLSRSAQKPLLLGGETALGNASRHPFAPQPWEKSLIRGALHDAHWEGGTIQGPALHAKALEFERWGWSRGTWPLGRLGTTGLALIGVLFFGSLIAWRAGLNLEQLFQLFFGLTGDPSKLEGLGAGRKSVLLDVVPGALYLALLTSGERMQPALRPGHMYMLSRAARADHLWRQALRNWSGVFARLFVAFLALFLVAGALSGSPFSATPPLFLISLALLAASLPLMQLSSGLRELYPGTRLAPWQALISMTVLAGSVVFIVFIGTFTILELGGALAWLALGLVLAIAALGQLALRRFLQRRMATMDLI